MIHFRGLPDVGEVFLFAAGALAGFSLLGLAAHRTLKMHDPLPPGPAGVINGMLNWFAVGLAIGSVALLAQIASVAAWPLSSFAGTDLYLAGASLQLALVAGRRSNQQPDRDAPLR